jgi:ppGpp synthetase/RelA/SpoT-type nucleotidyltranferase
MADEQLQHSRSAIDRAGKTIRHADRKGEGLPAASLELVDEFRIWHVPTVQWIQTDLTEYLLETVGSPEDRFPIASRLKTVPAIVAKLCRSSTALSRMQDIAGARIVVPDLGMQDEAKEATTNLLAEAVIDVKDQREEPDQYGYRAIHVIGYRAERYFEVQVRTFNQDRWAQIVERIDSNYRHDLKHGRGPAAWLEWLHELSDALRNADLGKPYKIPKKPVDLDLDVETE